MANYTLKPYQQKEVDYLQARPDLDYRALWWDTGVGKTLTAMHIVRHVWNKRAIVVTVKSAVLNWCHEIKKFTPDCYALQVQHAKEFFKNNTAFRQPVFLVLNYEALRNLNNFQTCQNFLMWFEGATLILDESHKIKNPRSQACKNILDLSLLAKKRMCLTATPYTNSVCDLWSQGKFLDRGQTFGKNFYGFRAVHCQHIQNKFWKDRVNVFSRVKEGMLKLGSVLKKQDVLHDLPPRIHLQHYVALSKEQARVYNQIKQESFALFENEEHISVLNVLSEMLRLQQIVVGHLPVTTPDGDVKIKTFEDNPRVDATLDLCEKYFSEGASHIIIWTAFKKDIEILKKALNEAMGKVLVVVADGSVNQNRREEVFDQFREAKACILIANRRACGTGINLIEASHSIVYSRDFNLETELQTQGRNYRQGSQIHEKIFQTDLICEKTIDEVVAVALEKKENVGKILQGLVQNENKCKTHR